MPPALGLSRAVAEREPNRGSQPYLPPPPTSSDDAPGSVHFPPMDPPPSSLGAMIRKGPRGALMPMQRATWGWVALLLAVVAVGAYYVGSRP